MAAASQALIDSTIDALYLAVTDESRWPQALASLGRAFDSPRLGILRMTPSFDGLYEMRALNHDPETQRLYNEYYWALDPTHALTRSARPGEWLDAGRLFDPNVTRHAEYVNDYAIPRGIRWVAGGKVHASPKASTLLGLQRPQDHAPFGDEARAVFERIGTHIGRAAELSAELRHLEIARGLSHAALNAIEWPVFAVNAAQRLLMCNRVGERELVTGAVFLSRAGRLSCANPHDAARLALAIRDAARLKASAFRVGFGPPFVVRVLPVSGYAGAALVYAARAERAPVPTEILQEVLGFTSAEAEIAYMLADGLAAKEIAFKRSVTEHTVRGQVREILRKAGVRRLSDLASVLAGIPNVR